jgi:hypothetical protein
MASLGRFTKKFGQGIRPNLFTVNGGFGGVVGTMADDESFLIKAAALPSSNLGTITIPYRGREIKRSGDRTFTDWSITVLCDEKMDIHRKFMDWSAQFVSLTDTDRGLAYADWQVEPLQVGSGNNLSAAVGTLGTTGVEKAKFNLVDCWPVEIGTVDLSFDTADAVAEFTVTIGFDHWTYQ